MLGAIAGDIIGSRFEGGKQVDRNFPLFTKESRITDDTVLMTSVTRTLWAREQRSACEHERCLRSARKRTYCVDSRSSATFAKRTSASGTRAKPAPIPRTLMSEANVRGTRRRTLRVLPP